MSSPAPPRPTPPHPLTLNFRLNVRCIFNASEFLPLQASIFPPPWPAPVAQSGPLRLELRIAKGTASPRSLLCPRFPGAQPPAPTPPPGLMSPSPHRRDLPLLLPGGGLPHREAAPGARRGGGPAPAEDRPPPGAAAAAVLGHPQRQPLPAAPVAHPVRRVSGGRCPMVPSAGHPSPLRVAPRLPSSSGVLSRATATGPKW